MADLNQVIKLCQDALKAGLDEGDAKFANELLASTLTQRAELVCTGTVRAARHAQPRAQACANGAGRTSKQTLTIDSEQAEAQFLIGRLYAHLGQSEKGLKALDEAVRLGQDDPPTQAKALVIRANLKTESRRAAGRLRRGREAHAARSPTCSAFAACTI